MLLPLGKASTNEGKQLQGAGTEASWYFEDSNIHFRLSAETTGWVAIGINESADLKGTYLIMARVRNNKAEVVEHYVERPGVYHSFAHYTIKSAVQNILGSETGGRTQIEFSLPIHGPHSYRKTLEQGMTYHILLAYSNKDDFKHHSAQRTSIKHKL